MFKQGQQIIYVPYHAKGDIHHQDCEEGFVSHETILPGDAIFCRFWLKTSEPRRLRTVNNSEATSIDMLVIKDTVSQSVVDEAMQQCGIIPVVADATDEPLGDDMG